MFERPSQRMSAAVGTNPSCIAQESPLLMCSLSLSKHIFFKIQSRLVIYIASGQRHLFHLPLSCILFKNDHNESIQLFGCERVRGTFLASDMRKTMQATAHCQQTSTMNKYPASAGHNRPMPPEASLIILFGILSSRNVFQLGVLPYSCVFCMHLCFVLFLQLCFFFFLDVSAFCLLISL